MNLLFITIPSYYLLGLFATGFLLGFLIQRHRTVYYRRRHREAEGDKLKMQAQMLGMGDMYPSSK